MRLAARGTRNMDDGEQVIEDATELACVRRQAAGVTTRAVVIAIALAALTLLL